MSPTNENAIDYLSEPGSPLALQVGVVDLILAQPQRTTEQLSLETLAHRIRTDTVLAQRTADIRVALAKSGREGRYRQMKEQMPAVVPALAAPPGTATKGISARYHNGLYAFDIDEGREFMDKDAVFASLVEAPGCVFVAPAVAGTPSTPSSLDLRPRTTKTTPDTGKLSPGGCLQAPEPPLVVHPRI